MTEINNLGINIKLNRVITMSDWNAINNAIKSEIRRRGKVIPQTGEFSPALQVGNKVEHGQINAFFSNVKSLNSSKSYVASKNESINVSPIIDCVEYIKTLMKQTVIK